MACACGSQPRFGSPCACHVTRRRFTRIVRLPLKPVGELRGVIYRASRAPGEAPKNYVHFFQGDRPCSSRTQREHGSISLAVNTA